MEFLSNKLKTITRAGLDLGVLALTIGAVYAGLSYLGLFPPFSDAQEWGAVALLVLVALSLAWLTYRRVADSQAIDAHYRLLVNRSWALVGTHNLDGIVLSANPAMADSLRSQEEEVSNQSFGDFFSASHRQEFDEYLRRVRKSGSARGQFRLLTKDGEARIWDYRSQIIDKLSSKPVVLIQALDITKRQVAENAAKQSEERFKDFAAAAADWWWETDAQTRIAYLSPRLVEHSGVAPERVLGQTLAELTTYWNKQLDGWSEFERSIDEHVGFRDFQFPMLKRDGGFCIMRISGTPFLDIDGNFAGYRGIGKDITNEHQLNQQLAYEARRDALTKLLNRAAFDQHVKQALRSAQARGSRHAMCYIDLDNFKVVNDTAGHFAGDELLRQISNLFRRYIRGQDALARLGGDEFAILLMNRSLESATKIANQIVDDVRAFGFEWRASLFSVSASVGVTEIVATSDGVDDIVRQSDVACYMAKEQGRNRVYVYRSDDENIRRHDAALNQATELSSALSEDRFRLYCQPIMHGSDRAVDPLMYEILLRLVDRKGNIVLPGDFIASAERYGFMPSVDRWVVERTLQIVAPRIDFLSGAPLALNISGTSLNDGRFMEFLHHQLDRSPIPSKNIYFEIAEAAVVRYLEAARDFMNSLKKRGCRFVLDDFGIGLSNYHYLRTLPIDFLKIDGVFVRNMVTDPVDEAIVGAIHRVGQLMGIETIAECTESAATLQRLEAMGVKYAQGIALQPPTPFTAIMAALSRDVESAEPPAKSLAQ